MKIIEILDAYLLDQQALTEKKSHWVTDAAKCRRAVTYRWRRTPYSDPPTAGNLLKMEFGDAAEWILGRALDWAVGKGMLVRWKAQEWASFEVPGLKYPVSMRLDFVVCGPEGEPEMIELKSTFGRGAKEVQVRGRPKDEALMQAFLYLHFNPAIRGGSIPYLARDNGYRTEFDVRLAGGRVLLDGRDVGAEEDGVRWAVERLSVVEGALEDGSTPARDYLHAVKGGELREEFSKNKVLYRSDWQCVYCWHRSLCWREVLESTAGGGDNSAMFEARKGGGA